MNRLGGALRWALLLMIAWNGPIPWCHFHGSLAHSDSATFSWLVHHLRACHAMTCQLADEDFDWHFHAYFPSSSSDDPDEPPAPDERRLPTTSGSTLAKSMAQQDRTTMTCDAPLPASDLLVAANTDNTLEMAGFFDRYSASLPLPMRFGVLRI